MALALLAIPSLSSIAPHANAQEARRPPAYFHDPPAQVQRELQHRGCIIPLDLPLSRNVVQGHFATPGQIDWAVLCSSRQVTSLLVFWNGSERNVSELGSAPNRNGLSDGYIRPVGKEFIMRHYEAYGGPKPPPIDHEGIESGGEHASTVFYRYHGKWLCLQGAD